MRNPRILIVDRNEDLAHRVRSVADGMRPRPEVHTCTRVGAVGEILSTEGPFDILVAANGLGSSKSGIARLEAIHDEAPGMTVVLAFENGPNIPLRDVIRAGAVDVLQLPVGDRELRDTLHRVVDLAKRRLPTVVESSNGHAATRPGAVFTMSSATGGCGKTFLATNLAYLLGRTTGKRACVVDLDLQFGEVSTALRLRPRYTIYDVLEREESGEGEANHNLEDHIEDYLVTHEGGFSVLAAPKDPSEADRIGPADVTRVIEALRARFDYVVVDTPAALSEIVLAAFDLSNFLYILATLDLPSVRNMGVFLSTLDRLKMSSDNVRLIMNKAEHDVGISVEQVTKLFPQGFKVVLPYAKEVSRSINLGMPVVAASPESEISRLIVDGFSELLPEYDRDLMPTTVAHTSRRRWSSFFRRAAITTTTTTP